MVFGSVMINKGYSTLDDITNSNTKSTHYAIVVLKSSKINSLSELQNESIEYCLQYDEEKDMNEVIAEAKKKESSLNFDIAKTYSKLGDDLYNNTVNAILINTAYNDAITLLNEHRNKLDLIAQALLEKEKVNEALKDLTSTQFRRIDLHIVNEITIRDVAKLEKVQKSQIQKSLELGLKKIKKFFEE